MKYRITKCCPVSGADHLWAPWYDSDSPGASICILCSAIGMQYPATGSGHYVLVPSRRRLLALALRQPGIRRERNSWAYCPGPGRIIRISERDALALGGQVALANLAPRLMSKPPMEEWAETIMLLESDLSCRK